MSLLSQIFQQNQQIAQNPTSVVRTPRQAAYDNLLNREYDLERQNKRNNLVSGLMSGIGGLGKIIANSAVGDVMQKAGAMKGISEQETRTDGLRQAYEQARQVQNKDYVQQAKDQLAMAIADEDKVLANDWKTKEFDYRKAYDDAKQSLAEKAFNLNKASTDADIAYKKAQTAKTNWEMTPKYQEIQQKQKQTEAEKLKEKNKVETQQKVNELQAQLTAFENEIPELEELNKKSNTNIIEKGVYGAGGILGKLAGVKNNSYEKPGLANREKVSKLKQKATAMLKATFGGNISDSERETILANFGLNKNSMSYQEFNTAVKLLKDYFANELNKNKEILKLQNNSGDTYNLGI